MAQPPSPGHSGHSPLKFKDFYIPLKRCSFTLESDDDSGPIDPRVKECTVVLERLDENVVREALKRSAYCSLDSLEQSNDSPVDDEKDPDFTLTGSEVESGPSGASCDESSELCTPAESDHSNWSSDAVRVKRKKGKTFIHNQQVNLTSTGKLRKTHSPRAKRIKLAEYSCDKCSFNCSSRQALKLHSSAHGANAVQLACDSCDNEYFSHYDLDLHKFNDHQEYQMVQRSYRLYCRPCKQIFPSEPEFDLHVCNHVTVTSDKFTCLSCKSFSTPAFESFQRHAIESHKYHLCNFCERSFSKLLHLETHCEQLHGDFTSPFKCDLCTSSFYAFGLYVEHRETTHALTWKYSNLTGYELCKFCIENPQEAITQFKMEQVTSYIQHMAQLHIPFEPFQCKLCEFKSNSTFSIEEHFCQSHDSFGEMNDMICDIATLNDAVRGKINEKSTLTCKKVRSKPGPTETELAISSLQLLEEECLIQQPDLFQAEAESE